MLATAGAWAQDGRAAGQGRERIGAVDATCLAHVLVVFLDVPTGSLRREASADDRTSTTWNAVGDERRTALGTSVLSLVSARAQALMQRAAQGVECRRMPDFFPCLPDLVQRYALAFARRVRQAPQALQKAAAVLNRHPGPDGQPQDTAEAQHPVEVRRAAVQRWEAAHRTDRRHLESLSLTRHPCGIADAAPPTSAQVASRGQAAVEARAAVAERQQGPRRHHPMPKVRTQVPALAALVDCWWPGVWRDGEPCALSPLWRRRVQASLLPRVSWAHQAAQPRWARSKARMVQALEAVRAAFDTHTITHPLAPQVLVAWRAWAADRVKTVQRAASAVAGRNGSLAPRQHQQRG